MIKIKLIKTKIKIIKNKNINKIDGKELYKNRNYFF